jgi:hypothetical protein
VAAVTKLQRFWGFLVGLAMMACVAFVGSDEVVIAVFCIGLFYAAPTRIASAFQPTEIIYIQ